MKIWLSRESSGLFMITHQRPSKHKIGKTDREEWYVPLGDALGVRHLCTQGVKMFFGIEIELGEQVQIEMAADLSSTIPLDENGTQSGYDQR
jgi:hypothetical protein